MNDDYSILKEKVRDLNDIVEVIKECGVHINTNFKAICPFHKEKTASFSVKPSGQFFKCFGCQKSGDIFSFIMLIENCDFITALHKLADRVGIKVNLDTAAQKTLIQERVISDILAETAKFYQQRLAPEAIEYLTKMRKLSNETIKKFSLGYANGGLKDHLAKTLGFSLNQCIKAGVLKEKDNGIKDSLYRRITIPISKYGRIVNLTSRSLNDSEPKYLHLKGEIKDLFNEEALISKEVFVCEGPFDAMILDQIEYPAVSLLGTNLKKDHVNKFQKQTKVCFCLDGDDAGVSGAIKDAKLLGERAYIVSFPKGQDPDDFINSNGREAFDTLVKSAQDIITYQICKIPSNTSMNLPDYLNPICEQLASMEEVKIEAYLRHVIKSRFGLSAKEVDNYRKQIISLKKDLIRNKHDNNNGTDEFLQNEKGIIRVTQDGTRQLTNFKAQIISQINKNDGENEPPLFFKIKTSCNGIGKEIIVPAIQFSGLNWIFQIDARATVWPGQAVRDLVRFAIQKTSSPTTQHIYTHTGWIKKDGKWYYLHESGAIGPDGLVKEISVELNNQLKGYNLPEPIIDTGDLKDVVNRAFLLLNLGNHTITYPLFCSIWRAVIKTCDFSVYLYGETGHYKTGIAKIILSFFGQFEKLTTWDSTANALEYLAFALKDSMLYVDDFVPTGTPYDVSRKLAQADRLLRAQRNVGGRSRLRSDGMSAYVKPPRGIILSSGETMPRGKSLKAGIVSLGVGKGDIDLTKLIEVDQYANNGDYRRLMSTFLKYLATKRDEVLKTLKGSIVTLVKEFPANHTRVSTNLANLYFGAEIFDQFLKSKGIVVDGFLYRVKGILLKLIENQQNEQCEDDQAEKFIRIIGSGLSRRCTHLASPTTNTEPYNPTSWGWDERSSGNNSVISVPHGDRIGWVDENYVYLDLDGSFKFVQQQLREEGDSISIDRRGLLKRLFDKSLLAKTDLENGGTYLAKKSIDRKERRVVWLKHETLLSIEPHASKPVESVEARKFKDLEGLDANNDSTESTGNMCEPELPKSRLRACHFCYKVIDIMKADCFSTLGVCLSCEDFNIACFDCESEVKNDYSGKCVICTGKVAGKSTPNDDKR